MGLPVTVYRWDDAGAPSLPTNPKPSDIITLLKKCLVTGYGEKIGLGWSVAFEDTGTFKVAFRNSESIGSGGFIQFKSKTGADTPNGIMVYQSAAQMLSLDNFSPSGYYNAFSPTINMTKWVVIGTSTGFYLILSSSSVLKMASGTNYNFCGFFGDIIPAINADVNKFVSFIYFNGNVDTSSWDSTIDSLHSGKRGFTYMYDVDGGGTYKLYSVVIPFETSYNSARNGFTSSTLTLAKILLSCGESTNDRNGVKSSLSTIMPNIRGAVPGLYQFAETGYSDVNWPLVVSVSGTDYFMCRQAHVGSPVLLINMVEW